MNHCPSDAIRWCVISEAEKLKCESMLLAFKAKDLKPELDCLYGRNTTTCMEMIRQGDADLINLDAADVYIAGRCAVNDYDNDTDLFDSHLSQAEVQSAL